MPNENNQDQGRAADSDSKAGYFVDPITGETLFEQPLVKDEPGTPAAAEPTAAPKGGKARAKKLGKAKLTAIAEKIKRSRPKR